MMMKCVALLLLLILPSSAHGSMLRRHHKRRDQDTMAGGFHPADVKDAMVREAVEFAWKSLKEGANAETMAYTGFDINTMDQPKVSIAKAETQVVAGMNFRLTLVVKQNRHCEGAFDIDIYNHFGDMSITSWGQEHTCDEAHAIRKEFKKSLLQLADGGASDEQSGDEDNA